VLACRDKDRAQAAVDQLTSGTAMPGQVEAMSLDLASLASIRVFTAELRQRLDTGKQDRRTRTQTTGLAAHTDHDRKTWRVGHPFPVAAGTDLADD
jgi:hypothetical protein